MNKSLNSSNIMKLLEEKVPDFLKEYPELVEWINEEDELHNIFTFFCTFFDKSYKMKDIKVLR